MTGITDSISIFSQVGFSAMIVILPDCWGTIVHPVAGTAHPLAFFWGLPYPSAMGHPLATHSINITSPRHFTYAEDRVYHIMLETQPRIHSYLSHSSQSCTRYISKTLHAHPLTNPISTQSPRVIPSALHIYLLALHALSHRHMTQQPILFHTVSRLSNLS